MLINATVTPLSKVRFSDTNDSPDMLTYFAQRYRMSPGNPTLIQMIAEKSNMTTTRLIRELDRLMVPDDTVAGDPELERVFYEDIFVEQLRREIAEIRDPETGLDRARPMKRIVADLVDRLQATSHYKAPARVWRSILELMMQIDETTAEVKATGVPRFGFFANPPSRRRGYLLLGAVSRPRTSKEKSLQELVRQLDKSAGLLEEDELASRLQTIQISSPPEQSRMAFRLAELLQDIKNYENYVTPYEDELVSRLQTMRMSSPEQLQMLFQLTDWLQDSKYYKAPPRIWKAILELLAQVKESGSQPNREVER